MTTILIVDDEPSIRKYLALVLGESGYRIAEAADGVEALERVRAERPDLIITDIIMPKMNGFEFVRRLRSDPTAARTSVVFITAAFYAEEAHPLALACGVTQLLMKPFKPDEILRAVSLALSTTLPAELPPQSETFASEHLGLLTGKITQKMNELEKTERALKEHQLRLQALFENTQDAILFAGDDACFVDANPAACALLGYSRAELLRMTAWEISTEQDRPRIRDSWRRFLAAGQLRGEYTLLCKDGTTREIECRGVANILPGLHLAVQRDITDRKRTELALQQSHNLLAAVIEGIPEAIYVKDLQSRYLMINSAGARIAGKPVEEVLGRDGAAWMAPETLRQVREADRRVMESGESEIFEHVGTAAGVTRTYLTAKAPFRGPRGELLGVLGISRDITERNRVEKELKRQKEILQTVFDHIPVMIAFLDPAGRVQLVNRHWERVLGWSLEEARSRDLFIELYPDAQYRQQALDYIRDAAPGWSDFKTRVRDGRTIDASWANVVLSDGTSIGFGQDITERKQAEDKLHEYSERLQSLSGRLLEVQEAERSRLARELHDELGQLLATVNYQLHALKEIAGPAALSRLEECSATLQRAAEQVRDLSLELRPVLLEALGLEAALRYLAEHHSQRTAQEVQVKCQLAPASLSSEQDIACFRIVQEALTNVAKHARASRVTVALQQDETATELVIGDDGIGFDVTQAEQPALKNKTFGLLGMKERVNLLGGRIDIESAARLGTTIHVHLPRIGPSGPGGGQKQKENP